ncbi:hypothetical protein NSZ01_05040 [Nocardioides szechwanensis]|uniref:Uncharacterized protein n=1 Tax=Nocardioides szechwanensis TaxID=1005944 RepID=A0A1G9W5D3_9ACTN|nr:hypothetical protein [Nocardioides szechwanensis]GEP32736.1 hypothetical protein NSZ01_05040 [Nocardioides szechwanensis]SDM79752.1 hypothetical protein SAMN05192576_0953 [Nocardioides szechwanensis]
MEKAPEVVDSLTLRFVGEEEDGTELHELRAAHVAEVLQGVVELASDFSKAGAFGDGPSAEVLVRPAQEGSFLMEVVRLTEDYPVLSAAALSLPPSLSTILFWATKSIRAAPSDFEYLENGNVKVTWQDNTVSEVPRDAWSELNKRKRRRKKQLRQIMAPLSDKRVSSIEVGAQDPPAPDEKVPQVEADFVLGKPDYDAARPEDEVEETSSVFETEAQMSAIDFDNADKWRVRTKEANRSATVKDDDFLGRISNSLAIRKSDIFRLKIREDVTVKNGRSRTEWTVVEVLSHRRAAHDDDS